MAVQALPEPESPRRPAPRAAQPGAESSTAGAGGPTRRSRGSFPVIALIAVVIVISITLATGMNRTTIMATSTFVLFRSPKPDAPKLTTDNYDPEMRAYRDGQVRHGADGTAWDQAAERRASQ